LAVRQFFDWCEQRSLRLDAIQANDGRGLAAYTHDDVLYQAYFVVYLVLDMLNVPLNPGNPYIGDSGP
jgi:hypothetical protein